MRNNKKIEILIPIFLFVLILITKIPSLNLPYYWDDFNYVIKAVDYVANVKITPFLWEYGLGHPPFFYLFAGLLSRIFGDSLIITHLIIVIFSFLTVYFTYLIGKELFNKRTGIIAALILFFIPMFFSFSGLFFLEMPLTALIIMALYFSIINKHGLYALFASLAVLTKETAIGAVLVILFIKILKEKNKLRITLIYSIPLLVFLIWMISNKIYYGFFLFPVSTSLITIFPIKNLFHLLVILKILFFDDFRWIISSIFFIQFVSLDKIKNLKKILIPLIIAIVSFFIFLDIPNILSKYSTYFPNINIYLSLMKDFSLLFSLIIFIILISIDKLKEFILNRKLWGVFILIISLIIMHSLVIPTVPRYLLPILPLIILILSNSISNLFKNKSYIIALIFIILSITQFYGERDSVGFTLETNLEYQDFIKVRQLGASYLESNFPNAKILTAYPLSLDLSYPYGKYVNKSLNVITIERHAELASKNYTQYLYPETIPEKQINLNEIDLYYHSPQEFQNERVYAIREQLNLTLIKKFEINNKSVEIYKVDKQL